MSFRQWPWPELEKVIEIESGWNPAARNVISNASGLLQWMPFNLKRFGTTPKEVRRMSIDEQATLIRRWFDELDEQGKKWKHPGDTYLAVAAPAHIGAPKDRVIYRRGSKAWKQNPLWRPRGGGDITAGSIRRVMRIRRERRVELPEKPARRERPFRPLRALKGIGILWVFMALVLVAAPKRRR